MFCAWDFFCQWRLWRFSFQSCILSEELFPLNVKCLFKEMSRCSLKWFTWRNAALIFALFNILLFFRKLDSRLEGWISLPTKNTKRFGWDKKVMYSNLHKCALWTLSHDCSLTLWPLFAFPLQYIVVSSRKILFYNSELDREQANPFMTLDIEWVISGLKMWHPGLLILVKWKYSISIHNYNRIFAFLFIYFFNGLFPKMLWDACSHHHAKKLRWVPVSVSHGFRI